MATATLTAKSSILELANSSLDKQEKTKPASRAGSFLTRECLHTWLCIKDQMQHALSPYPQGGVRLWDALPEELLES